MNRQLISITDRTMQKFIALYVRLSRDDENEGDSNSISHQIEILTRYCETHGITNYKIYKDDGYSGTNFNRPGFQEMMADIEAGKVSTVIVKDMSRFGRNYLEVGLYTEIRFPEMGVRFIAVNDGVDSDSESDNDFTPFRNIINEWYAKDTSKKIRAVFKAKGLSGQRLASNPPYGYLKGEDGNLIIDEETAPVVKLVYNLFVEGNGPGTIARLLEEREIPSPGTVEFQRTGRTRHYHPDRPCFWSEATVAFLLDQDAYLGQTTNFKTVKPSFKSKRQQKNPPEKQVTFENTHEAIIDRETWEIVQKGRSQRRRPTKYGEMGMFSGLAYCADCGKKLYHCHANTCGTIQEHYTCSTYRSRKGCTAHYIRAAVLEQLVLQNLQRVLAYVQENENEFAQYVMKNKLTSRLEEQERQKRQLEKQQRRIGELDMIIQRLYEDNITGKLSDERFMKLTAAYEQEQSELEQSAEVLSEVIKRDEAQQVNLQGFLKLAQKYTQPSQLTPAMLHELVEKIIVHAPDKSSGHRKQRIDVYYTFIGQTDLSPEKAENTRSMTA